MLVVNSLNGDYIAAEDVGTSIMDMLTIHEVTPYVFRSSNSKYQLGS